MKIVLFDIDDTLYNQIQPFEMAYNILFRDKYHLDVQALFRSNRKHALDTYNEYLNGEITNEQNQIYRIQRALKDYGVQESDESCWQFQKIYEENQNKIFLSDDVRKVLEFSKEYFHIGVLSNGPSEHQWNKVSNLSLLDYMAKEDIFISGDIGYKKPDIRIFEAVEQHYDYAPEDYLYVGDNYENDIEASKKAGWNTIWVNRRDNEVSENCVADYIVTSEKELLTTLQAIVKNNR